MKIAAIAISLFLFMSAMPGRITKAKIWQSIEEVNRGLDSAKKPVLIDVYTTWCHYCKLMDATTYRNDSVITYLQQNYYRYKLNAETRDSINWRGKQYQYNGQYKLNDFAVYLGNGSIVFPTTTIILPNGQPYSYYGQLTAAQLEMILRYFVEVDIAKISIADYAKTFIPRWK